MQAAAVGAPGGGAGRTTGAEPRGEGAHDGGLGQGGGATADDVTGLMSLLKTDKAINGRIYEPKVFKPGKWASADFKWVDYSPCINCDGSHRNGKNRLAVTIASNYQVTVKKHVDKQGGCKETYTLDPDKLAVRTNEYIRDNAQLLDERERDLVAAVYKAIFPAAKVDGVWAGSPPAEWRGWRAFVVRLKTADSASGTWALITEGADATVFLLVDVPVPDCPVDYMMLPSWGTRVKLPQGVRLPPSPVGARPFGGASIVANLLDSAADELEVEDSGDEAQPETMAGDAAETEGEAEEQMAEDAEAEAEAESPTSGRLPMKRARRVHAPTAMAASDARPRQRPRHAPPRYDPTASSVVTGPARPTFLGNSSAANIRLNACKVWEAGHTSVEKSILVALGAGHPHVLVGADPAAQNKTDIHVISTSAKSVKDITTGSPTTPRGGIRGILAEQNGDAPVYLAHVVVTESRVGFAILVNIPLFKTTEQLAARFKTTDTSPKSISEAVLRDTVLRFMLSPEGAGDVDATEKDFAVGCVKEDDGGMLLYFTSQKHYLPSRGEIEAFGQRVRSFFAAEGPGVDVLATPYEPKAALPIVNCLARPVSSDKATLTAVRPVEGKGSTTKQLLFTLDAATRSAMRPLETPGGRPHQVAAVPKSLLTHVTDASLVEQLLACKAERLGDDLYLLIDQGAPARCFCAQGFDKATGCDDSRPGGIRAALHRIGDELWGACVCGSGAPGLGPVEIKSSAHARLDGRLPVCKHFFLAEIPPTLFTVPRTVERGVEEAENGKKYIAPLTVEEIRLYKRLVVADRMGAGKSNGIFKFIFSLLDRLYEEWAERSGGLYNEWAERRGGRESVPLPRIVFITDRVALLETLVDELREAFRNHTNDIRDYNKRCFYQEYEPVFYSDVETTISAPFVIIGSQSLRRLSLCDIYLAIFDEVEQALMTALGLSGGSAFPHMIHVVRASEHVVALDAFADRGAKLLFQLADSSLLRPPPHFAWSPATTPFAGVEYWWVFGGGSESDATATTPKQAATYIFETFLQEGATMQIPAGRGLYISSTTKNQMKEVNDHLKELQPSLCIVEADGTMSRLREKALDDEEAATMIIREEKKKALSSLLDPSGQANLPRVVAGSPLWQSGISSTDEHWEVTVSLVGDKTITPSGAAQGTGRARPAKRICVISLLASPKFHAAPKFKSAGTLKDFSSLPSDQRKFILDRVVSANALAKADIHAGVRFVKDDKLQNTYHVHVPTPSTLPEEAVVRQIQEKLLKGVHIGIAAKDAKEDAKPTDVFDEAKKKRFSMPPVDMSQLQIRTWRELEDSKRNDMYRELEVRFAHMGYNRLPTVFLSKKEKQHADTRKEVGLAIKALKNFDAKYDDPVKRAQRTTDLLAKSASRKLGRTGTAGDENELEASLANLVWGEGIALRELEKYAAAYDAASDDKRKEAALAALKEVHACLWKGIQPTTGATKRVAFHAICLAKAIEAEPGEAASQVVTRWLSRNEFKNGIDVGGYKEKKHGVLLRVALGIQLIEALGFQYPFDSPPQLVDIPVLDDDVLEKRETLQAKKVRKVADEVLKATATTKKIINLLKKEMFITLVQQGKSTTWEVARLDYVPPVASQHEAWKAAWRQAHEAGGA